MVGGWVGQPDMGMRLALYCAFGDYDRDNLTDDQARATHARTQSRTQSHAHATISPTTRHAQRARGAAGAWHACALTRARGGGRQLVAARLPYVEWLAHYAVPLLDPSEASQAN